jgi:protein phosphatase
VPSVLAIVADGIGGHRAGEVAAEMAVDRLSKVVGESDIDDPIETLRQAVQSASQTIFEASSSDPNKKGMGATCICAWVIGDRLYTTSVGDSRLYLMRNRSIVRLNIDHTWIQEALDIGAITPEQARGHPNAHVIRRYLGSPQPAVPDFRIRLNPTESDEEAQGNQGLRLLPEDVLLLCSDGLHDLVEDPEILAVIESQRLETALETLVNMANERGGHDNITIVVMQVPKSGTAQVFAAPARPGEETPASTADTQATRVIRRTTSTVRTAPAGRNRRIYWLTCGGLALLFALSMLALAAVGYFGNRETPTPTVSSPASPTVTQTLTRTLPVLPSSVTTPVPQTTGSGPFITVPAGSPTPTYTPWPTIAP